MRAAQAHPRRQDDGRYAVDDLDLDIAWPAALAIMKAAEAAPGRPLAK